MKKSTIELLEKLDKTNLFHAGGQPLPDDIKKNVVPITSWREAWQCCTSLEWDNYTLEQSNLLTMYLGTKHPIRYEAWNEIVSKINEIAEPLVQKKIRVLTQFNVEERTKIFNCVIWAILAACMELEYADLRKPDFFCWLMEFYLLGRYPCGWGERIKNGKIALFGPLDDSDYNPDEPDFKKLVIAEQNRLISPQIRMPKVGKLLVY